jgi:hypothetical protein
MASRKSLKQFSEEFARRAGVDILNFVDLDESSRIRAFQEIFPATDDAWRSIIRNARIKLILGGRPERMRSITSKLNVLDTEGKWKLLGALAALERAEGTHPKI